MASDNLIPAISYSLIPAAFNIGLMVMFVKFSLKKHAEDIASHATRIKEIESHLARSVRREDVVLLHKKIDMQDERQRERFEQLQDLIVASLSK